MGLLADTKWVKRVRKAERSGHGILLHRKDAPTLYGMILEGDCLVLKNRTMPLRGAWATVDSAGSLQRQFAPAKMLAFGILGATKRVDNREVYFAVDAGTDGVAWCVQGRDQPKARVFAMKINTRSGGNAAATREVGDARLHLV